MPSLLADAAKADPRLCDKNSRAILAAMTPERIAEAAKENKDVKKALEAAAKKMPDSIILGRIKIALERC